VSYARAFSRRRRSRRLDVLAELASRPLSTRRRFAPISTTGRRFGSVPWLIALYLVASWWAGNLRSVTLFGGARILGLRPSKSLLLMTFLVAGTIFLAGRYHIQATQPVSACSHNGDFPPRRLPMVIGPCLRVLPMRGRTVEHSPVRLAIPYDHAACDQLGDRTDRCFYRRFTVPAGPSSP